MINKHEKTKAYCHTIKKSFTNINTLLMSKKNIIFVNVISEYEKKCFYSFLNDKCFSVYYLLSRDINEYESVGNFLRHSKKDQSVLVVDISSELTDVFYDTSDLIQTINANRDLFTKCYDNVVFICNPEQTSIISREAIDFWSCVDFYFDMTKWFCAPILPPVIKIKFNNMFVPVFFSNSSSKTTINTVLSLKNNINSISSFDINILNVILNNILELKEDIFRVELMKMLINKCLALKTNKKNQKSKIDFISKLIDFINISVSTIDIYSMISEYFYYIGEYSKAITLYQRIIQCIQDQWYSNYKDEVVSFLQCNIIVCKMMSGDSYYNEINIFDEFDKRLSIDVKNQYEYERFKELYYSMVSLCVCHHTKNQHHEVLLKLIDCRAMNYNVLDLNEDFYNVLSWEKFIEAFFSSQETHSDSIKTNIYLQIQKMIEAFCFGNYNESKNYYKKARYLCSSNGYDSILSTLKYINRNMFYLKQNADV